jgi:hypothetical protein
MAFDLLDLGGFAEVIDWLRAAFAGWRYLFSSSYRRRVHVGWKSDSWLYITWDIICAVFGCLFSLLLIWLLISLFAGFDWLTHLTGRLFHGTPSV